MSTSATTATATSSSPPQAKAAVYVTGANGFIGTWLVKTLLDSGYSIIHCSVFPGSSSSHLFSLLPSPSSSSLRIFEADLLDAAAISRAIDGCHGVFHVASPCTLEDPRDPQTELVDPAVKGTMNVLEASKKHGVRRLVLTSSISAMVPNPNWDPNLPVDESSWTDLDYCRSRQDDYACGYFEEVDPQYPNRAMEVVDDLVAEMREARDVLLEERNNQYWMEEEDKAVEDGMRVELDELKGVVRVAFAAIVALVAALLVMWSF
ncbi:hypothetical protein Cgig2_030257 [Carnegiea gigantea]|uniref:3-beta hydroxysteroid dehydrogenase/isomerase domain-containing protein n=1 Tax=Carnegiea gigantea TaxID=171969 RepID=A0A9Q1K1I3_9CARY|nr:hypothetical protein Cgig2_030257 [Carnegiea gigantea]